MCSNDCPNLQKLFMTFLRPNRQLQICLKSVHLHTRWGYIQQVLVLICSEELSLSRRTLLWLSAPISHISVSFSLPSHLQCNQRAHFKAILRSLKHAELKPAMYRKIWDFSSGLETIWRHKFRVSVSVLGVKSRPWSYSVNKLMESLSLLFHLIASLHLWQSIASLG